MYIYHLHGKMIRGEKLTPEEEDFLSQAFDRKDKREEKARLGTRKAVKRGLTLASVALVTGLAIVGAGKRILSSLSEYSQRPEVQESGRIVSGKMGHYKQIRLLENQAQRAVD